MKRREFIALTGSMAVWPLVARAQQKAMPVIGYVSVPPIKFADRALAGFRRGLAEYGYAEGQNVRFELRDANFQTDLLPVLYRELVNQKVSVIIVVDRVIPTIRPTHRRCNRRQEPQQPSAP